MAGVIVMDRYFRRGLFLSYQLLSPLAVYVILPPWARARWRIPLRSF